VANGERTWRLDKGWRAREIRSGDGGRGSLGLLVAQRFLYVEEQLAVLEKVLSGRLPLEYFSWNGRTH
jgi:hypothetical protein